MRDQPLLDPLQTSNFHIIVSTQFNHAQLSSLLGITLHDIVPRTQPRALYRALRDMLPHDPAHLETHND